MAEAFTWGGGGNKLTANDRRRRMAEAMIKAGSDYSPVQHWTQGLARVANALVGGWQMREADASDSAGAADIAAKFGQLTGAPSGGAPTASAGMPASAPSMAGGGTARTMAMPNVSPEIKDGIVQTASALGIDPVDLATTISYETGGTFDPTKAGPTTKWGQHRGLIQFGEPQAKQHGVDWANPVASQLGPNGAVASYLRTAGVKPGMGLLDVYSAINAGAPGLYNRSDAAAGGAPGTVRDKVNNQMAGHRAKAQALFADLPAAGASPVAMETGQPGFAVPQGAPAMSGATFNAIQEGQPLDPVFQTEGVSQPWMGTALQPAAPSGPQMAQAPLPPPRPADLAMPQADMPAEGAVPAVGQMPVPAVDWSQVDPNSPDGGVGAFQRMAAAGGQTASPFAGIVQALSGGNGAGAPSQATPASTGVENIARALSTGTAPTATQAPSGTAAGGDRTALAMAILNSPYAQPGQRAVAQMIVQQAFKDPAETEMKRLQLDKARREAEGAPLEVEGKRLDIEGKKKALGKAEAPATKVVKQADGSEVALQWDQDSKTWVPLAAPNGGNAVTGSPGNPYALPGKPTEGQSKDAGFAGRLVDSHNQITGLESVGIDKQQAAAGAVPYIGNSLSSPDKQKFEQAKRNFVTAILRKESGAAISAGEFETEEKKYFPQIGDSPEVIKQKRDARELAIEGVMAGAGSGYKVPEGYKPQRGKTAASPASTPDRSALEAEARRRGLIK